MSATTTVDVPPAHHATTRTPQNTPLNAAPISSRAQQPGVDSIKEGKFFICPRCPSSPPAHGDDLDRQF